MNARALAIAVALVAQGCGSDASPLSGSISGGTMGEELVLELECPELPPNPDRPRVLVIDDGLDPRHPVFQGKLAGCYRLSCPEPEPEPESGRAESDDVEAARFIDGLGAAPAECEIDTGVTLRIDAYLERFAPAHRAEWNATLLEKRSLVEESPLEPRSMIGLLEGASGTDGADFDYHGTATAGALAYGADVDVVFVALPLASSAEAEAKFECIDPDELAQDVRLLRRDDVREAYVRAPLSGQDAALRDLRRQHQVRVENRSFGTRSVEKLTGLLLLNDCPSVPLSEYAELRGALERDREAFLRESGQLEGADPLVIQAAGNDDDLIDTAADHFDCTPDRERRLLAGAYDIYRGRPVESSFSNHGDCVDVYGLGASVVVPAPNGFYVPASGTSIAAPLVARYAAALAANEADPAALRDQLLARRDELRFLPLSTMPGELGFYTNEPIRPQFVPRRRGEPAQSSLASGYELARVRGR